MAGEQRRVVQRRRIHESLWRDHGPLRLRHADHHPGSDPAGGRQHHADGPDHLGGQRQPDRRQRLCLGAHRQPDHLCAGDRRHRRQHLPQGPHRDHRHRARPARPVRAQRRGPGGAHGLEQVRPGDERRRGAAGLGLGLRQRQRPGQHGRLQRRGGEPGRPADHDLQAGPRPGDGLGHGLGIQRNDHDHLRHQAAQPDRRRRRSAGLADQQEHHQEGPYVTYAQSRPVLVSTVVAYTSESSVPGVLRTSSRPAAS